MQPGAYKIPFIWKKKKITSWCSHESSESSERKLLAPHPQTGWRCMKYQEMERNTALQWLLKTLNYTVIEISYL
jgi:hypothetical protein